jgi:hypothetical protein
MSILKTYQKASSQEINMPKLEVLLSRNLSRATQKNLSKIMRVRDVLGTETHLGLPSMVDKSKKGYFCICQK